MAKKLTYEECKQKFDEARVATKDYESQINELKRLRQKQVSVMRQHRKRIWEFVLKAITPLVEEEYNIINLGLQRIYYYDTPDSRFECWGTTNDEELARVLCGFTFKDCTPDDVVANKVKIVYEVNQPFFKRFNIVPLTVGEKALKEI